MKHTKKNGKRGGQWMTQKPSTSTDKILLEQTEKIDNIQNEIDVVKSLLNVVIRNKSPSASYKKTPSYKKTSSKGMSPASFKAMTYKKTSSIKAMSLAPSSIKAMSLAPSSIKAMSLAPSSIKAMSPVQLAAPSEPIYTIKGFSGTKAELIQRIKTKIDKLPPKQKPVYKDLITKIYDAGDDSGKIYNIISSKMGDDGIIKGGHK